MGRRNHPYFLCFVLTQAVYLLFVASSLIRFYVDLFTMERDESGNLLSTCDFNERHWAESCLIIETDFFNVNSNSQIILHIIAALVFLLSGGFALPVFQLFIT